MGGSGSKRRVIVEDAGPDGVVTVTEDVVRRLKGLPDKDSAAETKERKKETLSPPPTPVIPNKVPPPPQWTPITTDSPHTMKDVEAFYLQKLKDLQERNAVLQQKTTEQFQVAVKEVENKFMNFTAAPVCQDLQKKVLECYQANPKNSLNCSEVVSAFTACVDRARMAASVNRIRNVNRS